MSTISRIGESEAIQVHGCDTIRHGGEIDSFKVDKQSHEPLPCHRTLQNLHAVSGSLMILVRVKSSTA